MTTTLLPQATAPAPLPYFGAFNANAAYWIRKAADHLDRSQSTDDLTFEAGDALYAALGLNTFDGISKCYALDWGVEVGLAIASLTREDPFGDHTEAVAAIIAHYRSLVDAELDHVAKQDAQCGPRLAGSQRSDGSIHLTLTEGRGEESATTPIVLRRMEDGRFEISPTTG